MACPPQVPISIIPPVSQGPSPILWQNGNQITRLNTPLNPSFLVYNGSTTTWADGSSSSPVYLPNIQQVPTTSINYLMGVIGGGSIAKTPLGTNGQFLGTNGTGLVWQNSSISTANNLGGGAAGEVVYQSGVNATAFTAVGTTGQVLTSNGSSAPTWVSQSALSVGNSTNATNATLATTATTANSVAAGSVTPAGLSASVGANAWLIKTSTYIAQAGDRISANTSSGAFTITLPTSPATGTIVTLSDGGYYWATNNLTVAPGGANTINGSAQNFIGNVNSYSVYFFYNGTTWRVLV